MGLAVERWTVQYGDEGPREVRVPHAWGQDVSVEWEGPALYKTMLEVPKRPCALRFHGVSYACRVTVAGRDVGAHEGIWDAWDVDLSPYCGTTVEVGLEVVKNGGRLFPVESVLSGFLPYVHQTWGGPFRPVELVSRDEPIDEAPVSSRIALEGRKIRHDGGYAFPRGVLHWGWYPEVGGPEPGEAEIAREIATIRAMGFNMVKFCLWLPPHSYLEQLDDLHMMSWLELPLWAARQELFDEPRIEEELERIVRQYRRHRCIAAWTIGCQGESSRPRSHRQSASRRSRTHVGTPRLPARCAGIESTVTIKSSSSISRAVASRSGDPAGTPNPASSRAPPR